jgi:hypothetical protein
MKGDLARRVATGTAGPRRGACGVGVLLALALSTLLTGCRADTPPTPTGVPASPTGAPPGSPLVDGLRTPPGTLLLGGAFPRPRGAAAVMLVTGDPMDAFRDLAGQAQRRGYALRPQLTAGSCWLSTDPGAWWNGPGDDGAGRSPASEIHGLGCAVTGWTATSGGQRRYVSLRLLVGATDRPYLAHLGLAYTVADADAVVPVPSAGAFEPPALESPFRPLVLTRVPGTGEALGQPFVTEPALRVAAGTSMLAPPFPADCGAGGFLAVLAVTGDVGAVVEAYAAQFTRAGLPEQQRPALPTGPPGATYLIATTAGGGEATITTIVAGDRRYALVERCQD